MNDTLTSSFLGRCALLLNHLVVRARTRPGQLHFFEQLLSDVLAGDGDNRLRRARAVYSATEE